MRIFVFAASEPSGVGGGSLRHSIILTDCQRFPSQAYDRLDITYLSTKASSLPKAAFAVRFPMTEFLIAFKAGTLTCTTVMIWCA